MTSCFVYKVMGLTFHNRINTQLIYKIEIKIEIAHMVARRITKPQRTFSRFESHWLLFFIHFIFIIFLEEGGGGGLILLFWSCLIFFFLFIFFIIFSFLSL